MTDEEKTYSITVSPEAAEQVKKQLEKRGTPDAYLRLGLKGGGCSGFSYVLMFEDVPLRTDYHHFESNGVKVLVDPKSMIHLNGCTLDWESGLVKRGFKFRNPNEKSSCGCGHSFSV